MKHILISIITCFTVFSCFGQDVIRKSSLSLNFGPGYIIRQDLIFSPFIHTGFSFSNVGIVYTREAKLFQKVSLQYGNYSPSVTKPYNFTVHSEANTAYPHSFNLIDIDYLIGKNLRKTEKSTIMAGGLFTSDIQALSYVYGRISSFGYYSAFSLGIFGKYRVAVNEKNYLTAALQMPVVVWFSRPPYMGIDDEFIENISSHSGFKTFTAFIGDGELVTWNRLQTFDLGIKHSYSLNEKWDLGAGYLFEFIHANQPQKLLSFRNSIQISATFRF